MEPKQDWFTEEYKGMDVHVTALARDEGASSWDFSVRVTQPGDDAASASELAAESGDNGDFASREAAVEAGFVKGYSMVDALFH